MKPLRTILALVFALSVVGCDGLVTFGGGDDDDDGYTDPPPGDGSDRSLYFYYGPMKLMFAETVLYSIESITGHDFGGWDFTAPDPGSQAFSDAGNADGSYYPHCRLLGGCMEHRIPQPRTSFVGTAYVLQFEKAAAEACYDRGAFGMFPGGVAPDGAMQAIDVIDYQYRIAFGRHPSNRDLERSMAYFDAHLADPEFDDVSALESAGRGHCRALLTTNRFLFY